MPLCPLIYFWVAQPIFVFCRAAYDYDILLYVEYIEATRFHSFQFSTDAISELVSELGCIVKEYC